MLNIKRITNVYFIITLCNSFHATLEKKYVCNLSKYSKYSILIFSLSLFLSMLNTNIALKNNLLSREAKIRGK